MDDENDVIEMITAGTFNEKNGKKYLIYDETIVEGGDQTHNIVKIWPDKVEVTKRGLVDTHMTFECGKKHRDRRADRGGEGPAAASVSWCWR